MDPALKQAATTGDVDFLKKAFLKQPLEYFLTQAEKAEDEELGGNIFHLASWNDKEEFIREAINILPKEILKQLLFQVDDDYNWTPLHTAALKSDCSYNMVMLMKGVYKSLELSYKGEDALVKPWLAETVESMTALHQAMKDDNDDEDETNNKNDKCAIEILLMDTKFESCTIVDDYGNTPLYYALKNGFNGVSEKILRSTLASSSPSSIFCTDDILTPFGYADRCSDVVLKLLFEKFGEWLGKTDEDGFTILHKWAEDGEARPCRLLLDGDDLQVPKKKDGDDLQVPKKKDGNDVQVPKKKDGEDLVKARNKIFKHLIYVKENKASETPLHIAARNTDSELGKILIRGYKRQVNVSGSENQESAAGSPWKVKNKYGNTPLHCALYESATHEEFALELLLIDPITLCKICNNNGESPFFLAVKSGCDRVVDAIMKNEEPRFQMFGREDGTTVLHVLSACSEEIGQRLLKKYWWIINLRDDLGYTALDYAENSDAPWLVDLLSDPSLITEKEKFDWIEAIKREETPSILAFTENYLQENDTPLHHIKLHTEKEYLNFLKIPAIAELKNTSDPKGATPLHRALERNDRHLAKLLLLDQGVERNIRDHNGNTSLDLLAGLCRKYQEWGNMCKLIKVDPYLRTSYIQSGTNLDQVRNTLSVVAALLATITFAAGFTLPGGLDNTSGEAVFAKRTGFLVFLLADVFAMCSSMLVLFCLIWSMVSEPDMARVLVDRSVFILMLSLYGTLLAFMAGIYTMIKHSSLWAAIVIFIMCSIIGVSANRPILNFVMVKLFPAAGNEVEPDQMQLLEEGNAGASSSKENNSTLEIE